jgi:hypothetical protein
MNTYGRPSRVGLYWIDPRLEGTLLKATLRYIAIEDISDMIWPELQAFYAKDSLRITEAEHNPNGLEWIQGARDYIDPVPLVDAGETSAGSVLDLEVAFDLAADLVPGYIDWPVRSLRLVAYVQDTSTKEILQCRQVSLRAP